MNQNPFQSFFGSQGPQQAHTQIPQYLAVNQFILEIVNNWEQIKKIFKKYKEGTLKKIHPLEQEWFNFLTGNNIDIFIYENEIDFQNAYWKIPQN